MEKRWVQRFNNFEQALTALKTVLENKEFSNDIIIDAAIQRFEVTYELAWKTIQDYLYESGHKDFRGPKNVFIQAFQTGIIVDGQLWNDMNKDRNVLSHEYVYEESREIFQNIVNIYIPEFSKLLQRLKDEQ